MPRGRGVDPASLPYRRGVGIALFDRRGLVFVATRIDTPGDAWQMPQGGIDAGEAPRDAAFRELAEETGIAHAGYLGESDDWIPYDLPRHLVGKAWRGRYRGQMQKWFALAFLGEDRDIDLRASRHPEFSAWRWVPLAETPALIVPFKRDLYARVAAEFAGYAVPRPAGDAQPARSGR
jgi:putative (di)nucleoside polyphosphate hydrolase